MIASKSPLCTKSPTCSGRGSAGSSRPSAGFAGGGVNLPIETTSPGNRECDRIMRVGSMNNEPNRTNSARASEVRAWVVRSPNDFTISGERAMLPLRRPSPDRTATRRHWWIARLAFADGVDAHPDQDRPATRP